MIFVVGVMLPSLLNEGSLLPLHRYRFFPHRLLTEFFNLFLN